MEIYKMNLILIITKIYRLKFKFSAGVIVYHYASKCQGDKSMAVCLEILSQKVLFYKQFTIITNIFQLFTM